ncbi:MAG: hypothetical protein IIT51_05770, partial [Oscillospiraceae bacterium]|nr:hypothetical protein [Oscillospiraceae bacterium]
GTIPRGMETGMRGFRQLRLSMISLEEYKKIISELLDELPEAFFQKLSRKKNCIILSVIRKHAYPLKTAGRP